jgi:hypothetical protein
MDGLALKYVETRDKKITQERYELARQLEKLEKESSGYSQHFPQSFIVPCITEYTAKAGIPGSGRGRINRASRLFDRECVPHRGPCVEWKERSPLF